MHTILILQALLIANNNIGQRSYIKNSPFISNNYQMKKKSNQTNYKSQNKKAINDSVQKINSRIKLQDLYHILCLRPFQCILDQNNGGLPKGLKIVQRTSQTQYQIKQVKRLYSYDQFQNLSPPQKLQMEKNNNNIQNYLDYLRNNNGDNLLCQMKMQGAIQMAICICMYNQDREMLNNTLLGVGQNIANLCKQGVDPDKIAVIIVQDGIEKMHKSILELFKVFECQSGMRFNSNRKKNIQELVKEIQRIEKTKQTYGWQGQQKYIDMNSFLFTKQEEKARQKLRFLNVKKQYDEIKKIHQTVKQMIDNKKNINRLTHEDLPSKALQFFKQECKASMLKDRPQLLQQSKIQQAFEQYYTSISQNIQKSQPLIQNALTKTKQYCEQYIDSRQSMSHVSFFRTGQYFPQRSGLSPSEIDQIICERQLLKSNKCSALLYNIKDQNKQILKDIHQKTSIKMNIFFVVKYKNNQKLSSHNWFFNGFCKQFSNCQIFGQENQNASQASRARGQIKFQMISPRYTILLDVGLRPQSQALCKMYNTMENNQNIGGVCGYMGLKIQKSDQSQSRLREEIDFVSDFCLYFVDIQRAQQLEYHFAHLIDKGFQSIFKFIHVLPGAFSGYNMKAIWGSQKQQQNNSDELLQKYFKSINQKLKDQPYEQGNLSFGKILCRILLPNDIVKLIDPIKQNSFEQLMYQSNVYLAEDRILCMGIHKNNYDLMFLPDAYSFVDPVKDIQSLMGQRKRWINGSFFAFEKVSDEFKQMSCCQCLNIQIWYLAFMNLIAYIAPGFYLFSINVAMQVLKADVLAIVFDQENNEVLNAFVYTMNFIYALMIFGLVFYSISLTNREKKFINYSYGTSTFLGIVSIIMLVILLVDIARGLNRGSSYLISNQNSQFTETIPGGQATIDILRYIVLGTMGLYALPLISYSLLFLNIRIIFEVLFGALSFAFYSPTYLIILNIYALCRMDDLSWGTKGLQSGGSGKDDSVLSNWKTIKTIHVGKFIFWNVITAGLLIHFGSNYLVRFYLTFALMVLIASTMFIKVILSLVYYLYYKICINTEPVNKKWRENVKLAKPSLYKLFQKSNKEKISLKKQIKKKIKDNIIKSHEALGNLKNINLILIQLFNEIEQKREIAHKIQKNSILKQMKIIDFVMKFSNQSNQSNIQEQVKNQSFSEDSQQQLIEKIIDENKKKSSKKTERLNNFMMKQQQQQRGLKNEKPYFGEIILDQQNIPKKKKIEQNVQTLRSTHKFMLKQQDKQNKNLYQVGAFNQNNTNEDIFLNSIQKIGSESNLLQGSSEMLMLKPKQESLQQQRNKGHLSTVIQLNRIQITGNKQSSQDYDKFEQFEQTGKKGLPAQQLQNIKTKKFAASTTFDQVKKKLPQIEKQQNNKNNNYEEIFSDQKGNQKKLNSLNIQQF